MGGDAIFEALELALPRESLDLAVWFSSNGVPSLDALLEIRNALARDGVLLVIDVEGALPELDERARHSGFSRRRLRRTCGGCSVLELQR